MRGGYMFRPHLLYYWLAVNNQQAIFNKILSKNIFGSYLVQQIKEQKCKTLIIEPREFDMLTDYANNYIKNNYCQNSVYKELWIRK